MQFKEKNGKLEKPKFNGGYQCDVWFEEDNPPHPEGKLWNRFVQFMEPEELREKTRKVWSTYDTLRKIMSAQTPSKEGREFIGPATFQHFLAYRYTSSSYL